LLARRWHTGYGLRLGWHWGDGAFDFVPHEGRWVPRRRTERRYHQYPWDRIGCRQCVLSIITAPCALDRLVPLMTSAGAKFPRRISPHDLRMPRLCPYVSHTDHQCITCRELVTNTPCHLETCSAVSGWYVAPDWEQTNPFYIPYSRSSWIHILAMEFKQGYF